MKEIVSQEELDFLLGKNKNAKIEKNTQNNKKTKISQEASDKSNKKNTTQSETNILTNEEKAFFTNLFKRKQNKEQDDDLER